MIEFHMRNGNKEANLKAPSLTSKQLDVLIERSFDVLMSGVPADAKPKDERAAKEQIEKKQQQQGQDPEHWKTGIMHKDGTPHYKLRLECPSCGLKKNLYQPMGIEKVECEQCKTLVRVEPATEKGFGSTKEHRDQFGNFMVARKHYSRPKQLPKVGSENRSSFQIAELIGGVKDVAGQSG